MVLNASPQINKYFEEIENRVQEEFKIAEKARKKGFDPSTVVDIKLAKNLAERVVGLISIIAPQVVGTDIVPRIVELEKEFGSLDWRVSMIIAHEVAQEKFCKFKDKKEAIEVGIRVGFAYSTVGVVSSPLEGFTDLEIKKRLDGKGEYFCLNFAGPIRNAGGTNASVCVLIADYVRKKMGYAQYDATEKECERCHTELIDYHSRITNLQYVPSKEEMLFMVKNMPVEISGMSSEKIEVSNYKDLPRVPTNLIRSGYCLMYSGCLPLKGPKLWKKLSKWGHEHDMGQWDFLKEFLEIQHHAKSQAAGSKVEEHHEEKKEKELLPLDFEELIFEQNPTDPIFTYINDLVAGRPVISHPLASGGLRLRYGRSRTSGYSAQSLHPATLVVLDSFFTTATQIKVERPGKAAAITTCDTIMGPVVLLNDGSVVEVQTEKQALALQSNVKEVLYVGDVLINYGDYFDRAAQLNKPGYCEEWWALELEKEIRNYLNEPEKPLKEIIAKVADIVKVDENVLYDIVTKPLYQKPSFSISKKLSTFFDKLCMHPQYTFFFTQISFDEFLSFLKYIKLFKLEVDDETNQVKKMLIPYSDQYKDKKRILEKLGIPHFLVSNEYILIESNPAQSLLEQCVLYDTSEFEKLINYVSDRKQKQDELLKDKRLDKPLGGFAVLKAINQFAKIKIKDKAGTFIGARMGRPEKAKMRKMQTSPHGLFPVGEEGGRMRSFQDALEKGTVDSEFEYWWDEEAGEQSAFPTNFRTGNTCVKKFWDNKDKKDVEKLDPDKRWIKASKQMVYPFKEHFNWCLKKLDTRVYPDMIKGVLGTASTTKSPENPMKSILRAKHELFVNKDGTVRYDGSEVPITHFKPKEVGTSVEKLRELGYTHDIYMQPLTHDNQVLQLFPQDLVLPSCDESPYEPADEVFFRTTKYIDEELEKLYDLPAYYNLKNKEDLAGHYIVVLAPHTSAGSIARIVGSSQTQGLFCHPLMHAAIRRDCVYPSTTFIYEENGVIKSNKIGDVVENLIRDGAALKTIDSYGTKKVELPNTIYALGVDPKTKKIKKKKITYFVKAKTPEKWIKIKTCTGREQIMTPRHKFMYLDNKYNFKSKKASEIVIGDKIGVLKDFTVKTDYPSSISLLKLLLEHLPHNKLSELKICGAKEFFIELVKKAKRDTIYTVLELDTTKKINLSRWYKGVTLSDIKKLVDEKILSLDSLPKNCYIQSRFNLKKWDLSLKVDDNLMKILGYYAAEGYCRQNKTVSQVCFRMMDADQKNALVKAIHTYFNIKPNIGENDTKITISNRIVYYLFKYIFNAGSNAYSKRVPDVLFNVNDKLVKTYLSAYFDGDGTILSNNTSEKRRHVIVFYSVSRELVDGIALLTARFGILGRYSTTKPRLPGKHVLDKYSALNKSPKTHILHHLSYYGKDFTELKNMLTPVCKSKRKLVNSVWSTTNTIRKGKLDNNFVELEEKGDIIVDRVKSVETFVDSNSAYCFEVDWKSDADKNVLWGEQIINARCDGDEGGFFLLLDAFLNFSTKYLNNKLGATMDAPLVLTSILNPSEVDDMVFNMEQSDKYPLEFYEAAMAGKMPWDIKFPLVNDVLGKTEQYDGYKFTHDTDNINSSVKCSVYKTLPSMKEKLDGQMALCSKLRCVDESDVARIVIEKHFIKDTRGNLRKFSQQVFRCTKCGEKYRRPPLSGKCVECGFRNIIFTVTEGSIKKYVEYSIQLASDYHLPPYLQEALELTRDHIDSLFGRETEKQEGLGKFFG